MTSADPMAQVVVSGGVPLKQLQATLIASLISFAVKN